MLNRSEPLGLPRGSIRGLIALMLTLTFCVSVFTGQALNDTLVAILGVVITFYFVKRDKETDGVPVEDPLADPVV